MMSEPIRARILWPILSLVLPVKFGHTTACRSPAIAFPAAILSAKKRFALCSAVLRHPPSSWAAVVHCVMTILDGHTYSKSVDQPGKTANPAHGQLNRENNHFPVPRSRLRIWSRETGLAVPSRVSLLISILRLNRVLTYGIPPEFRGGVHFIYLNRHTPSGQSRDYRVTQLRTDDVHCRESAGTGPVTSK